MKPGFGGAVHPTLLPFLFREFAISEPANSLGKRFNVDVPKAHGYLFTTAVSFSSPLAVGVRCFTSFVRFLAAWFVLSRPSYSHR